MDVYPNNPNENELCAPAVGWPVGGSVSCLVGWLVSSKAPPATTTHTQQKKQNKNKIEESLQRKLSDPTCSALVYFTKLFDIKVINKGGETVND